MKIQLPGVCITAGEAATPKKSSGSRTSCSFQRPCGSGSEKAARRKAKLDRIREAEREKVPVRPHRSLMQKGFRCNFLHGRHYRKVHSPVDAHEVFDGVGECVLKKI